MSDILNPLGGRFVGPSGPLATTLVLGTVADPPRGLRQVDPGTIIKGIVLGRESDGLTAIATDKGTVRVAANIPLVAGAQVTLEVRPTGDRLQVLILANDTARTAPQSAGTAAPQPGPSQTVAPPLPSAASGTSSGGIHPVEARPAPASSTPAPTPPRVEPSIEFVGSSQRAIVVQTSTATTSLSAGVTSLLSTASLTNSAPAPILVTPSSVSNLTVVSAATVQATLLAAGVEKKGRQATHNPVTATDVSSVAKLEGATSSVINDTPESGQSNASPTGAIPLTSALTADAKQRIMALFAAASTMPGLAETKPAVGAVSSEPLPIGAELKLRVLAVQMQGGQEVTIDTIALDPQDAHRQIIFGRVVSVTPAGHAVIHTPMGDIMLQDRSSLMPGAQIALAIDTLQSSASPVGAIPIVQTPQQALLSLSQSWPTLADIVSLLQGTSAEATRAAIDADTAHQALAMLPHAGIRLAAGLMSAMAALRSGDLALLLGPLFASKGIGSDKEEMMKRLKGEFAQLSILAQDRPEVDWRAMFLPVLDDQGHVTRINLFYRRPKKDSVDASERGTGTRFVVEADFSRLGPFQLDGLMRPQRFDLMVRSRQRLTDRMRREIEAIYEEARGLTGFAGSIAFQTVDEFPVIPLDDLKKDNSTYTV